MKKKENRINNDLRFESHLYLINEEGVEKHNFRNAINIADSMNLDLVEISKKDGLPLCKLLDYDKFIYDKKKKDKQQKSNKQTCKEIRLTANISEHDMNTKIKNVESFISKGDKVKVVLFLKGRQNANKDFNKKAILDFVVKCEDFAIPENLPTSEGNKFIVYLKKKK